jgi:subtilisin family serine protease
MVAPQWPSQAPRTLTTALMALTCAAACDRLHSASTSDPGGIDAAPAVDTAPAPQLRATPDTLSFAGTSAATVTLETNGSWRAETRDSWLSVSPTEGEGSQTLTITVDRTGLGVDSYGSSLELVGEQGSISVPVLMRFPEVRGTIRATDGSVFSFAAPSGASSLEEGDHAPGEVLLRLDPQMVALESYGRLDADIDAADLNASLARLGARVGARQATLLSPALGLALIEVAPPSFARALALLENDGRTLYAEPNTLLYPTVTDDPHYDVQWHFQQINLESAWALTTGVEEVIVAVIDADFHPAHPDLAANLLPGWNFVDDTDDLFILNEGCGGHGTHVAGTVAAVTNNAEGVAGVAPGVRVLPLNVAARPTASDEGECPLASSAIARAILYAAGVEDLAAGQRERPVDVINLSLGGEGGSRAVEDALELARSAGVVAIAAAGNSGDDVIFPARLPTTLAVSATDQHREITPYSSRGPEVWVAAPGGDLSQPLEGHGGPGPHATRAGVLSTGWAYDGLPRLMIYDTIDDDPEHAYLLLQGTSMASPHVAGVVALMRSVNPHLNLDAAARILADTALDLGSEGRDDEFGHGLVDAAAAVAASRDFVVVPAEEILVHLRDDELLVAETRAESDGSFNLGAVGYGDYTLVAGDFHEEEDDPVTVYGEVDISVDGDGDLEIDVLVSAP